LKIIKTFNTFKYLFKNNNEKLELFNLLKKLNFNQQSAAPWKVPPGARAPLLATPLATVSERYHQWSRLCYQRYEKRLVQQNRSSKCWCFQKKIWRRDYN